MTKELIEEINSKCPYEQGIFCEPYGIPTDIKEPVIYTRWETGGVSGGSCWGGKYYSYQNEPPSDRFKVLDLVLEVLRPNVTYLQYKQIESMVQNNEDTSRDYYGNSSEYKCEYIILSELEEYLNSI